MIEWLTGFFNAISHFLPPKFFVYGASNGGYQMSLFASTFPERVEKLFLASPVGFAGIPPADQYDPYSMRISDRHNTVPARDAVELSIHQRENNINVFYSLVDLPAD